MKSLSSQLIITESADVLRNSVVQLTEKTISYRNIFNENHETAHTLFYDGIISPPIVSLSRRGIRKSEVENCGYTIILFDDLKKKKYVEAEKIIIDFGTENLLIINDLIKKNNIIINNYDCIKFIIACTVSPTILLKNTDKNLENRILWSGINLVEKTITAHTTVSFV